LRTAADDVANHFTDEGLRQISAACAATKTVNDSVDDALDEAVGDEDYDLLTGISGADWFILSQGDRVTAMS